MKNSFKKVAALALAILMLLMLVPASLASDGETVSNAVVPGLSDGGTLLTSLKKYSAMFEKLMAEEDPSAFAELAAQYMQDAGFLDWLENSVADGTLSSDQIDALNARTALLLDGTSDVDTLAISGANSVGVGNSITLTGTSSYDWVQYSKHEWESSDTSIATVSSNGSRATVTGVKQGSVTITHRYKVNDYFGDWHTETYNVQVESSVQKASVFYLKSPTANPNSNNTGEWGKEVTSKYAEVDLTGATYDSKNKNIFSPASHIISMPGPKQDDGSYLLPKENNSSHYSAIYNAYKEELAKDFGTDVNNFSEKDIEAIYLIPYKISVDNGIGDNSHNTIHIDCMVSVKCNNAFTVKFWVEKPDEAEQMVDSKNYLKKDTTTIAKTEKAPTGLTGDYPNEITVGGVVYVFDGWYNEADKKVTDEQWENYTPTEAELVDGTVNFYAHYEPKTTTVTVMKSVQSNVLSDKTKDFTFKYQIDDGEWQTITLKDSETVNIQVDTGSKIVVTETTDDDFDTGYVVGSGDLISGNSATINQVTSGGQSIFFKNTRKMATLKLKKVLDDENNPNAEFDFTVTYTLNGTEASRTYNLGKNDHSDEISVPVGTELTITESNAANYTTTATYGGTACRVDEGENGSRTIIVTASETANPQEIVVTNTIKTGTLIVKKNVTGGWGDKTKQFSFTHDYGNGGSFNLSDIDSGGSSFSLEDIPYGTTVTITEADYTGTNGGYTTSYTVSTGETNVGGIESTPTAVQSRIATVTIGAPTTTVTFTNHKDATIDTGVLLDSLPYILILAAIAVVAGVVIVRRRRSRDDD